MGIGRGSLDENENDVERILEIKSKMEVLVQEWEGMGTWNPFPLTLTPAVNVLTYSAVTRTTSGFT